MEFFLLIPWTWLDHINNGNLIICYTFLIVSHFCARPIEITIPIFGTCICMPYDKSQRDLKLPFPFFFLIFKKWPFFLGCVSPILFLSQILLGSVWLGGWKIERIENWDIMEKWKNRKNFSFSRLRLVGRMKK